MSHLPPPKKFMLIHYMQPDLDIHIMFLQEKGINMIFTS